MVENNQYPDNIVKDKTKIFKNGTQSALNYVQTAIENSERHTQDATQNLVNDTMRNHKK